jgi:anti-sigma factor RsiW
MKINLDDPNLTAYALDELSGTEKAQIEAAVSASPEAQEFVRELRLLSGNLRAEYAAERDAHLIGNPKVVPLEEKDEPWSLSRRLALAAGIALCACLAAIAIGKMQRRAFVASEKSDVTGEPAVASSGAIQTPVEGIEPPAKTGEVPKPTHIAQIAPPASPLRRARTRSLR